MSDLVPTSGQALPTPQAGDHFRAFINGQPLQVSSLTGRLMLRPELSQVADHWIWKIIAEGKVGQRRTSIGLFFDRDLAPGTYPLVGDSPIRVVYNEAPHSKSVIYHSAHLQSGSLTLLAVDPRHGRVQGRFDFGISAVDFEVNRGRFSVQCES